jgi:hypothetical protein
MMLSWMMLDDGGHDGGFVYFAESEREGGVGGAAGQGEAGSGQGVRGRHAGWRVARRMAEVVVWTRTAMV